ncbi:MAG TPA: hypothetical protein VGJ60_13130 [Chloroflexota bacterium]
MTAKDPERPLPDWQNGSPPLLTRAQAASMHMDFARVGKLATLRLATRLTRV